VVPWTWVRGPSPPAVPPLEATVKEALTSFLTCVGRSLVQPLAGPRRGLSHLRNSGSCEEENDEQHEW
jgi:hypothetical protein